MATHFLYKIEDDDGGVCIYREPKIDINPRTSCVIYIHRVDDVNGAKKKVCGGWMDGRWKWKMGNM
jgi:hypothetical protein